MPRSIGALAGHWRIVESDLWDQDALDLDGPATLELKQDGTGQLTMIAIGAAVDGRFGQRDGRPSVEFSFQGFDDGSPVSGRGWAALLPDGALAGELFLHFGDESGFRAERAALPAPTRSTRGPRRRR